MRVWNKWIHIVLIPRQTLAEIVHISLQKTLSTARANARFVTRSGGMEERKRTWKRCIHFWRATLHELFRFGRHDERTWFDSRRKTDTESRMKAVTRRMRYDRKRYARRRWTRSPATRVTLVPNGSSAFGLWQIVVHSAGEWVVTVRVVMISWAWTGSFLALTRGSRSARARPLAAK